MLGCATAERFNLRPPPDIDKCALIKKGNVESSYGFCASVDPTANRQYRKPAQEMVAEGYICVSPDHYGETEKFTKYLEAQALRRCR